MKDFKEFLHGFTLAEVLVTLGIIGVVSALTMPALIQNYQKTTYVTQLHKVYNDVSQAAVRYKTDNNLVSLTESRLSSDTELNKFVTKYFKITKNCNGSYIGCFANTYRAIEGNSTTDLSTSYCKVTVVLASGAALCFDTGAREDKPADKDTNNDGKIDENDKIINNGAHEGTAMGIELDINGVKGPNIAGRDLFRMDVAPDGTVYDAEGASATTLTQSGPFGIGRIIDAGWDMTY